MGVTFVAVIPFVIFITGSLNGQQFFPPNVLGETHETHEFMAEWYSKHLIGLREPSLSTQSQGNFKTQVYRFLWLRSFHRPISVRVELMKNGTWLINSKITNGHGGYAPGKLIHNRKGKLSEAQTQRLIAMLKESTFWDLPSYQPSGDEIVLDGAEWIVEGLKDGKYHVVHRISPPSSDRVQWLGVLFLIDLARLKLLYQEVY